MPAVLARVPSDYGVWYFFKTIRTDAVRVAGFDRVLCFHGDVVLSLEFVGPSQTRSTDCLRPWSTTWLQPFESNDRARIINANTPTKMMQTNIPIVAAMRLFMEVLR
jgi:hypothetical protein